MPATAIYDDKGNLAASNSSDAVRNPTGIGFGPVWRRYLTGGLYNGEFAQPPESPGSTLDNTNNPLPYWNLVFAGAAATSITAQWLADAASASGGVVRFVMAASALAGDELVLEQLVALNSSRTFAWNIITRIMGNVVASGGTAPQVHQRLDWIASDGTTVVGTGVTRDINALGAGLRGAFLFPLAANIPPATAAYARVRFGVHANVNADFLTFDMTDVASFVAGTIVGLVDDNGVSSPGAIQQSGGAIWFMPQAATFGGATNGLTWDGANLNLNGGAGLLTTGGDFRAGLSGTGTLIAKAKSGTPVDGDMTTATNGGIVVDTTANKIWARTGAATWKGVVIAGVSAPREERRCPVCLRMLSIGQDARAIVNEYQEDRARHMFWRHADCGWRWRIGRLLRRLPREGHVAWYTAAIRRIERRRIARFLAEHPELVESEV